MPLFVQDAQTLLVNVRDFGATGNGTTDDTTAITNAINAVASSGGVVYFPAGTYITQTQLLYTKVHLWGAGYESTILKLKSGTNSDLLQGSINGYSGVLVNIAATNASGVALGVDAFSLQDITLDGNKSGQTGGTSWVFRVYAMNYRVQNVVFRNGYTGGVYSDWNSGAAASNNDKDMAAQWTNFKIHDCNGIGLEWAGPHDSQLTNGLVYNSGTHNIHIGPNATAILMNQVHPWNAGYGVGACSILIEGSSPQFANCFFEGSDTCNIVMLAGDCKFSGCNTYSGGVSSVPVGLQIGQATSATLATAATSSPITLSAAPNSVSAPGGYLQFVVSGAANLPGTITLANGTNQAGNTIGETITVSANGTYQSVNAYIGTPTVTVATMTGYSITVNALGVPYADSVNQSGGLTTSVQVGGYSWSGGEFFKTSHANGAIHYANDGAGFISGKVYLTTGKTYTGSISARSSLLLNVTGLTADGTNATSGLMQVAAQTPNALKVTDNTNLIFNVDAYNKYVGAGNLTALGFFNSANTTVDTYMTRGAGGLVKFNGTYAGSGANQGAIASSGTLTTFGTNAYAWIRTAPTSSVTGIIMQAGVSTGQECTIFNESSSNSITFAASGTSNVADGASDVIAALTCRKYVWDGGTNLWYRAG